MFAPNRIDAKNGLRLATRSRAISIRRIAVGFRILNIGFPLSEAWRFVLGIESPSVETSLAAAFQQQRLKSRNVLQGLIPAHAIVNTPVGDTGQKSCQIL